MFYLQFQQATNFNALLEGLTPYFDISAFEFWLVFFNIDTAFSFGLDNWGRILNFSRDVKVPDYTGVFGFDTGQTPPPGLYPQNFDHGSFYGGQYTNYPLTDAVYRIFLKLRFAVLHCNFSIQQISRIMNKYAQDQNSMYQVVITTTGVMSMNFDFNYALQDYEIILFQTPGILPVPAGVSYTFTYV